MLSALVYSFCTFADELIVRVADPFIELHSGPGRGYPIIHVAEQDEYVSIVARRNRWFKVADRHGHSGWVKREQMERTLSEEGGQIVFDDVGRDDLAAIRWEAGFGSGEADGRSVNSVYLAFMFTPNISVEVTGMQLLGDVSEGEFQSISMVLHPFPQWRISPFFNLGIGEIDIKALSGFSAEQRSDDIVNMGLGARIYLTQRFFLRLEYKNHVILTNRNDNDELKEWKAGLSVFF